MGRIEPPPPPFGYGHGQFDDAMSLNTQQSEDEMMDTPPAYSDSSSVAGTYAEPLLPELEGDVQHEGPGMKDIRPFKQFNESQWLMDPAFDHDPIYAESMIRKYAEIPPEQMIRIEGTHEQSSSNGQKKERMVDFDFQIPLVDYLVDQTRKNPWAVMQTVENHERTHRGSIFKRSAANKKHSWDSEAQPETTTPGLKEWCHLYCASHARTKSFRITRTVSGLNTQYLSSTLEALIRSTNYRGHTRITFPTPNRSTEIHSSHRLNILRFNTAVRVLFYITFLWLFAWPYLFFTTKKWAVVRVDWPYSRTDDDGVKTYLQVSEETFFARWRKCIEGAVLGKRKGCLTIEDLVAFETPLEPFRSGSAPVDRLVEVFGAGIRGASEVRRQWGWGGDC